jgi:hypothetical protein
MPSLTELAQRLNENPEQGQALMDQYLAEVGNSQEVRQIQIMFSQLQRIQKMFVGIRNDLNEDPDLTPVLFHCSMALDKATASFGMLLRTLNKA